MSSDTPATRPTLGGRMLAELVGTFALVLAGTGAIVVNDVSGGAITHVGVSLTFGLVVTGMIFAFGKVSGAHINPAVTLGFVVARRFAAREAVPYIAAQVAGALLASGVLALLFPAHATLGATLPSGVAWQSFVLEVALTWILMLVILRVSSGAKESGVMAGVLIGVIVAFEALFAGPISGASMNPARSLAPAIVSGHLEHLAIYLSAPVLGALLAVPTCRAMQPGDCCPGKARANCP